MRKKKKVSTSKDGKHWLVVGQEFIKKMGDQRRWDKGIEAKIHDECVAYYGVGIHSIRKIFDATAWVANCYPDVLKNPPERFALTQALLLRSIHRLDPSYADKISQEVFKGKTTVGGLTEIKERLWKQRREGGGPVMIPTMTKASHSEARHAESSADEHQCETSAERTREGRVAIRALPGRCLRLDGQEVLLPEYSNLDLDVEAVVSLAPDALLIVDDWDVFTTFKHSDLDPSAFSSSNILMLYGGDRLSYPAAAVQRLIEALGCRIYTYQGSSHRAEP
jgi:hypothetical protein